MANIKVLCEICGDEIPKARLEILPNITYCVKCSDKHKLTRDINPDDVCAKPSIDDHDD